VTQARYSQTVQRAILTTLALALLLVLAPTAGAAPSFVSSPGLTGPGKSASLEIVAPDSARACTVRFKRRGRTDGPYRVTLRGPYIRATWKTHVSARGVWTARVACGTSKRKLGSLGAVETPIAATRKGKASENDGLRWPHFDALKWPHLGRLLVSG